MPRKDTRPYRNGFEYFYATHPQLDTVHITPRPLPEMKPSDEPLYNARDKMAVRTWNGLDRVAVTGMWQVPKAEIKVEDPVAPGA
mmetsp:Transcript_12913/g.31397  ORF Transcript_12913/g.31397 Transcript_12913/m.31397 type:complete len:85 (-) Transcript_12913:454-708(-)